MSDIQTIIELIEKGYRNGDYSQGQRQINDALFILRKMQKDSHLNFVQRLELSQILECGPLYKDIERAVREMKFQQLTHSEEMGRVGTMFRLSKIWEELGYQDPEFEKQKWVVEREIAFQELCEEIGLVDYDKNNMSNAIHRLSSFILDGLAGMQKGNADCE